MGYILADIVFSDQIQPCPLFSSTNSTVSSLPAHALLLRASLCCAYPSKHDSTRSVGRKLVPFYSTFSPKAYLINYCPDFTDSRNIFYLTVLNTLSPGATYPA